MIIIRIFFLVYVSCIALCLCDICEPWESVELTNFEWMDNGTVWDKDNELLYDQDTYWNVTSNNDQKIYGCPCKLNKPCMRKCCAKNEAMNFKQLYCIPYNESWPWFDPYLPSDEKGLYRKEGYMHFGLAVGNFCRSYLLEPDRFPNMDEFYVNFTDGKLTMTSKKRTGLGVESYCVEYLPQVNRYSPYVCMKKLEKKNPAREFCSKLPYNILPIGMITSTFFLLISLSVFFLIPTMRNIQGKCLMCQMSVLIITYVSLTSVQLFGLRFSRNFCITLGIVIYFSFLSSFFWFHVICFDMCSVFSSKLPRGHNSHGSSKRKFFKYISYALGIPLIITIIVAVIELDKRIPNSFYKPEFRKTCWIYSDMSKMIYFIAPVGLIIISNMLMFIITAYNIWREERDIKRLNIGDSRRHDQKEDKMRFYRYIKLFILMGLTWIMEVISVIAGGSPCIWIFTDFLNTLQGVYIFFIFVFKRKVKNQLVQKMRIYFERVHQTN